MSTRNCNNCNTAYGPDDMFCENCGYDFITGSLPSDAAAAGVAPAAPTPPGVGAPPAAPSVLSPAVSPPRSPGAEAEEVSAEVVEATEGGAADGGTGDDGTAGEETAGEEASSTGPAPSAIAAPAEVPRLRIVVSADRAYFDEVVNDGEIDFPDPAPGETELELAGTELHIGRTSESRAIHPDIDVAELTGDQAVSSRHAVLRVADDGGYTIVDVGSTNGTFLATVDSDAITQGVPVEVPAGTPIFVGAWTRIVVV